MNIHIRINVYYHSQNFNKLEGQILLNYIDNQAKSKKKIAEDLKMSRRNLYQLFESQKLTPETKKKFEDYFKAKIFPVPNAIDIVRDTRRALETIAGHKTKDPLFKKVSDEWAVLRLLIHELALINSKEQGRPFQECLDELNNKVHLVLRGDKGFLL